MKKLITLILILIFILPFCSAAQSSAPEEAGGIALEVFQMTQSLDELVKLLKEKQSRESQALELQKLETAIAYLSFRNRRIEIKEQELQDLRSTRDRIAEIVAQIEADPESWNHIARNAQSTVSSSFSERPADFRARLFKERIENMEGEILARETEVNILVGELAELEEFVQEKLELVR